MRKIAASALAVLAVFTAAAGKLQITPRPGKATKNIQIFPQLEAHYGTFQNFMHYWKDRPLYVNPAHRYKGNEFTFNTEPSELKHIEQCKLYNVAGLTPLGGIRTPSCCPIETISAFLKPLTLSRSQKRNSLICSLAISPAS